MNYKSGAAFRRALEDRLRNQSLPSGLPLVRLRKMVAFERFLARLITDQPDYWVLKGGLAIQLRLGSRARTTQDIDLLLEQTMGIPNIHQALVRAALLDLNDWFRFEVAIPSDPISQRFSVQSLLDGRIFESFHIDVGMGDPMVEQAEVLSMPGLLEFAGIGQTTMPCYPVSQQIAEKVHAYTRPYVAGDSTRVKDWVDILLLAQLGSIHALTLREALDLTFDTRATHPLPSRSPDPPAFWSRSFHRLAEQTGLAYTTLPEAVEAMRGFLDPVLQNQTKGTWDPLHWGWQ